MDGDCWLSPAVGRDICNTSSQAFPKGCKWASSPTVTWWCQGRAWKCNSAVSFSYTSHSLGSQFWTAKRSWLQGAGEKKNQHRFVFSDPNPPLLRNTHDFHMSQSWVAEMKLHPLSFVISPPAVVCVPFLYNAGSSQSLLLQSNGSGHYLIPTQNTTVFLSPRFLFLAVHREISWVCKIPRLSVPLCML